jgi:predicted ester cyclase
LTSSRLEVIASNTTLTQVDDDTGERNTMTSPAVNQQYSRDELVARIVRAGELEISGGSPDELASYFAPTFRFDGPGGFEADFDGLVAYFAAVRDAFDDLSIHRGIVVVEGNLIACQTRIEGLFVREFTQTPVGTVAPNGRRVVYDLINIFRVDDQGRLLEDHARFDNHSVLDQMGYQA